MAILTCKFGITTLPVNFKYKPINPRRISRLATLGSNITQYQSKVDEDKSFEWSCDLVSSSIKNAIDTLYLADTQTTFTDLDEVVHTGRISEYFFEEEAGYFNLRGVFIIEEL